ncbi:MAG: AraC family transcriptional regulator [Steroidobacteraceae bacterium]
MDALSQVLVSMRMEASIFSHFVLGAPWGLHCPKHPGIPFYAVVEGTGWLVPDGGAALPMIAGDLLVLPRGSPHSIVSAPGATVVPLIAALEAGEVPLWMPGDDSKTSRFQHGGPGPTTRILAGAFYFGARDNPLTRELPPLIRLDNADVRVWPLLDAALRFIADEQQLQARFRRRRGGAADLVFLQGAAQPLVEARSRLARPVARTGRTARPQGYRGHAPRAATRPRTVPRLARLASMSRSANFAAVFQSRTGTSPKAYLTRWRMQLAATRLAERRAPLAAIAEELGYRSASAFARTFRRMHGQPPGRFRRAGHAPDENAAGIAARRAFIEQPPLGLRAWRSAAGRGSSGWYPRAG